MRLEVCITQKNTKRAFLIALVHMPLTVAVRRPIRERYPLIPCMNYTIPNNMRVYSARDIILENAGSKLDSSSSGVLSRSNSSTSSTLDGASSTASQKFVSLNLSDSDDDEMEVAGILEIKSYSPVKRSPISPRNNPASSSITIPEDLDTAALREIVMGKDRDHSKDVSIDMSVQDQTPKVKKKIIPNEIFPKKGEGKDTESGTSEDDPVSPRVNGLPSQPKSGHSPSAVVNIGHSQEEETVVDITKLQGDVVIEVPGDSSNPSQPSTTQTRGGKKKKILPPTELLSQTAQKLSEHGKSLAGEEGVDSGCVYDDIASDRGNLGHGLKTHHAAGHSDLEVSEAITVDLDLEKADTGAQLPTVSVDSSLLVEDTSKLPGLSIATRLRSGSEVSSEVGSTATSRPETPVWDFYDFTDETPAGDEGGQAGESSGVVANKARGDDASQALGTLQETILRLSRSTRLGATAGNSDVLETERVSGPVLPTVMIEDFEEMEEATEEVEEQEEEEEKERRVVRVPEDMKIAENVKS